MAELQANGVALSDQDKADARSGFGLGSAATAAASDFATAAQGTDAREWTAATVLQAEAEAGTDAARKAWTVQRVWQAAAAWWASSAAKTKLDGIASGATVNAADATLLARSNHTGTQTASTISDFSTAADARIAAASLDALANVSAPSPTNGQVLQFNGTAWVPGVVSGAGMTAITTPVDADGVQVFDSTAGFAARFLSWANLKARLKTYFDTIYNASYEVATFADLPAANSVTVGRRYTVLAAVITGGSAGTVWASDGTVWRPAGGQLLYLSTTQIDGASGGITSEQLMHAPLLPAAILSGVRELRVRSGWIYSATDTNARTLRMRLGSAGTTSDTEIARQSAGAGGNTIRKGGASFSFLPSSSTTLKVRIQSPLTGTWVAPDTPSGSTSAYVGDTTVSSLAGALYLSTTIQQGASPTSTASLVSISIWVE